MNNYVILRDGSGDVATLYEDGTPFHVGDIVRDPDGNATFRILDTEYRLIRRSGQRTTVERIVNVARFPPDWK